MLWQTRCNRLTLRWSVPTEHPNVLNCRYTQTHTYKQRVCVETSLRTFCTVGEVLASGCEHERLGMYTLWTTPNMTLSSKFTKISWWWNITLWMACDTWLSYLSNYQQNDIKMTLLQLIPMKSCGWSCQLLLHRRNHAVRVPVQPKALCYCRLLPALCRGMRT